jgi:hypothetical protein
MNNNNFWINYGNYSNFFLNLSIGTGSLHHRRLSLALSALARCANGESPLPLRLTLGLRLGLALI